jgi:ferric-dicitrate binding protein FerR (iron transport regulator)
VEDTKKGENEQIGDIVAYAHNVLEAVKHPNTSEEMEESREAIYNKVERKIDINRRGWSYGGKRFIRYFSMASAIALLIVSAGILAYFYGYDTARGELAQGEVEINVPWGVVSQIVLPDGTKVTLNGGSQLTYPTAFAGERHVILSGEGFFDVSKDPANPFYVHTKKLSIKVLGTCFAFKAYAEDKQTLLTLQSGSVKVFTNAHEPENGILLKPNQQIVLDNETQEYRCKNVIASDYTSWKDGILTFRSQTIEDIAVVLERHFRKKIYILSEKIGREQYTAQFKHGEGLEEILDKLSYKRPWKYIKRNGTIEIVNNK